MLVQDPLSGYLHEVPDAQPHYGGYGGGYYGGYDEYVEPSMAEYPGELGMFFLPKIISAITGGAVPPPPVLPHQQLIRAITGGAVPPPGTPFVPPPGIPFVPPPGIRAYIVSVVKDVLAQTQPGAAQMAAQGGMYRRRRRRR